MNRAEVLDHVKTIITQDRNATHGEPEDSFSGIAELWNIWFFRRRRISPKLTSSDVAQLMAAFKFSRLMDNPDHADNWDDQIGYLACGRAAHPFE